MADRTQDANLRFRYPNELRTESWNCDSSSAQTLYKGVPMILDANVDTVNVVIHDSNVTAATNDVFVGIAAEAKTVAASATESAQDLLIYVSGEIGFPGSTFTDADVGKAIYMSDSSVFTTTATANILIGYLTRVTDGFQYIQINPNGGPSVLTIS